MNTAIGNCVERKCLRVLPVALTLLFWGCMGRTSSSTPTGDTTPPTAPTSLTATAASSTQINLTWTASTDNVGVTGYKVERCQGTGCSSFKQIATPSTNAFNDTGLTAATPYSYRVRATDAAANLSSYSNTATATTLAGAGTTPPTAPTNLTAKVISPAQINLTWTASTDNVGVTGYKVERCQGTGCSNFAQIATPSGAAFSDTGLTGSTSYTYRVRATDAAGNLSAYSTSSSANTPAPTLTTPTNLAASAASSTQINLRWAPSTETGGTLSGYVVQRCQGAGCNNFAQVGAPTGTSFNDTGLTPSTAYSYRVRAQDGLGNSSSFSAVATASTPASNSNIAVSVTPARGSLAVTQTLNLVATVTNDAGSAGVTWSKTGGTLTGQTATTATFSSTAAGAFTITATSNADSSKSASATVGVTDLAGVFTHHNDVSRSGANQQEYSLTLTTVSRATFGKLFFCTVDGAVYAQPLWIANATINGGVHNVVIVATQHDTVYAFDADSPGCVNLWGGPKSLIPAGETWGSSSDANCGDLVPDIGIVGTPVIDPVAKLLYIVTKTKTSSGTLVYHQRIHALDLASGSEKLSGPKEIQAAFQGNNFDPLINNQRPALLLQGTHVIIGWASHCDNGPYEGWLISYNAGTLVQEAVWNAAPSGSDAGIWMSGSGPAVDSSGNIFVATGNGTWDGTANFGDSVVKLGPQSGTSFTNLDYFTPVNQSSLSGSDEDLGSGGVLLLPDISGGHPHLAVQVGKEGKIYLLNRDNLGHILCTNNCSSADTQIVQELPGAVGGVWGAPAYWNGSIYFGGSGDNVTAFSFNASGSGLLSASPTSSSSSNYAFPGPTPSVSATGLGNGIVWVLENSQYCTPQSGGCGPTVLHAYDATNLATELWNSAQVASDKAGNAVKFTVPTVANGRVYVGTRGNDTGSGGTSIPGELDVYGLKP